MSWAKQAGAPHAWFLLNLPPLALRPDPYAQLMTAPWTERGTARLLMERRGRTLYFHGETKTNGGDHAEAMRQGGHFEAICLQVIPCAFQCGATSDAFTPSMSRVCDHAPQETVHGSHSSPKGGEELD